MTTNYLWMQIVPHKTIISKSNNIVIIIRFNFGFITKPIKPPVVFTKAVFRILSVFPQRTSREIYLGRGLRSLAAGSKNKGLTKSLLLSTIQRDAGIKQRKKWTKPDQVLYKIAKLAMFIVVIVATTKTDLKHNIFVLLLFEAAINSLSISENLCERFLL